MSIGCGGLLSKTQEVEVGGSGVEGHPQPYSKLLNFLGYASSCLKTTKHGDLHYTRNGPARDTLDPVLKQKQQKTKYRNVAQSMAYR